MSAALPDLEIAAALGELDKRFGNCERCGALFSRHRRGRRRRFCSQNCATLDWKRRYREEHGESYSARYMRTYPDGAQ